MKLMISYHTTTYSWEDDCFHRRDNTRPLRCKNASQCQLKTMTDILLLTIATEPHIHDFMPTKYYCVFRLFSFRQQEEVHMIPCCSRLQKWNQLNSSAICIYTHKVKTHTKASLCVPKIVKRNMLFGSQGHAEGCSVYFLKWELCFLQHKTNQKPLQNQLSEQ